MRSLFYFLPLIVVLVFTACSGQTKPPGLPPLFPCEITVTQDGQPLAGANIVFYGGQTWVVGGGTGNNGVAKIYTQGTFEGAPAGTYKVTVTKTVTEGGPTEADRNNPSYAGDGGTTYDTVDKQFRSVDTTPLEIEVQSGKNAKTLDVEKSVKVLQPKA